MRVDPNANPEMYQKILAKLDKDGDGQISEQEKSEAKAARGQRGGGSARPGGVHGDPRGAEGSRPAGRKAGGPKGGRMPQEVLDRQDANGDGTVSEEEKAAAREKMGQKRQELVAAFDADGDGKLNEAERAAAKESMPPRSGGTRGLGQAGGAGRRGGVGRTGSGEAPPFAADLQRLGTLARSIYEGSEPPVAEVQSAYDETGALAEQIQESEVPDQGRERILARMDSIRSVFANFLQSRTNFVV